MVSSLRLAALVDSASQEHHVGKVIFVELVTAMHGKPWQFVIILDAKLLKRVSDRVKETFSAASRGREATRRIRSLAPETRVSAMHLNVSGALTNVNALVPHGPTLGQFQLNFSD